MMAEQAKSVVIGVGGKGGARCAGFLAPDLPPVGGVDLLGLVAQGRDLLFGKTAGQEQIALLSELPKLLHRQRHHALLPLARDGWLSRARFAAAAPITVDGLHMRPPPSSLRRAQPGSEFPLGEGPGRTMRPHSRS